MSDEISVKKMKAQVHANEMILTSLLREMHRKGPDKVDAREVLDGAEAAIRAFSDVHDYQSMAEKKIAQYRKNVLGES